MRKAGKHNDKNYFTRNHAAAVTALAIMAQSVSMAEIQPAHWGSDFSAGPVEWANFGVQELFNWSELNQNLQVTWDSSRTNSYFYLPLGITLTRDDDFQLTFSFNLNDIAIGTTEGKASTFQISMGLIGLANAFDPAFFRGTGVDPEHGGRNILELTYFPDSGFGATVAPTILTRSNEFGFSGNYPLELQTAKTYKVEMTFNATEQKLRTRMWEDGAPFGLGPEKTLQDIDLTPEQANFHLDAIAIASYSDDGQLPDFAGSVLAHGIVDDIDLTVWNRPRTALTKTGDGFQIAFETNPGWTYHVETSGDLREWEDGSESIEGTGGEVRTDVGSTAGLRFYRVRGERN